MINRTEAMLLEKYIRLKLERTNHIFANLLKYDSNKFLGPLAYSENIENSAEYDAWIDEWNGESNWLECLLRNTRPVNTEKLLIILGIYPKRKYVDGITENEFYVRPFDYVYGTNEDFLKNRFTIVPISSEDWLFLVKAKSKDNPIWLT